MRTIIVIAATLISLSANAANKALVCLFEPTKNRFNIITRDKDDYIQWGGNKFEAVVSEFDGEFLTVIQYAPTGTFRMVWNPKTGEGYGGAIGFDGKKTEGKIICAVE